MAQFREQLAIELTQDSSDVRKVGRRSKESIEQKMQEELTRRIKRTPTAAIPSEQVRIDGSQHWPNFVSNRRVCRLPGCNFSHLLCAQSVDYIYVVIKKEIVLLLFIKIN